MKKYTITEFRAAYPDDDACLHKLFQLRYSNLVCKCGNDQSTKPFTRVKNRRSYQCPNCGFQIYPTQGTVFDKTTTPLTYWFYAIYLQTTTRNGVAAKELERQLCVCYKTALRMNHQIKKLMANKQESQLTGIVECDEAFLGSSVKNLSNKKREEVAKLPYLSTWVGKTTIFGLLQRNGRVVTVVADQATRENAQKIIRENIEIYSKVMTDSSNIYKFLSLDYYHYSVNHAVNEFARGEVHTNSIESYWNMVKRTIKGTHIHVSVTHLQKYLDEISFRWMNKHRQDEMFDIILSHVA